MRTKVLSVDILVNYLFDVFERRMEPMRIGKVLLRCCVLSKQGMTKLLYTQSLCIASAYTRPLCIDVHM